jgi:hypothetical protein
LCFRDGSGGFLSPLKTALPRGGEKLNKRVKKNGRETTEEIPEYDKTCVRLRPESMKGVSDVRTQQKQRKDRV